MIRQEKQSHFSKTKISKNCLTTYSKETHLLFMHLLTTLDLERLTSILCTLFDHYLWATKVHNNEVSLFSYVDWFRYSWGEALIDRYAFSSLALFQTWFLWATKRRGVEHKRWWFSPWGQVQLAAAETSFPSQLKWFFLFIRELGVICWPHHMLWISIEVIIHQQMNASMVVAVSQMNPDN